MINPARSKAEEKFAKVKQQEKKALKEREKSQQGLSDKIARLRSLRLAKEAADRIAADAAATEKRAADQEAAERKAAEKADAKKRKAADA